MTPPSNVENKCTRGEDFRNDYISLCFYYKLCPSTCMKKIQLDKGRLHCTLDLLDSSVWTPLLEAIEMNESLEGIVLHSEYLKKMSGNISDCNIYRFFLEKYSVLKGLPIILKPELLTKLIKSLSACIYKNKNLKFLEITGLPLSLNHMECLSEVFPESNSLQHLSLSGCFIEKNGLTVLCKCLRIVPSVKVLDLSNCHITLEDMKCLVSLIEHQAIQRNTATWYKSLRYRHPILDSLPGIRRVTLNDNVQIGDEGVKLLTELLFNDIWLKALDLQNCDISDIGAKSLLNVLNHNMVLEVLDLQMNSSIDQELLEKIQQQLDENNKGKMFEFNKLSSKKCLLCESLMQRVGKFTMKGSKLNKKHQKTVTAGIKEKTKAKLTRRVNSRPPPKNCGIDKESDVSSSSTSRSDELEEWVNACYHLQRELKICFQQLQIEQGKRKLAEMKVKQLESQGKASHTPGYTLIDDATLNTIQNTFVKFQEFLNFLKISGLEDITKFQSGVADLQSFISDKNRVERVNGDFATEDTARKEVYIPDMIQNLNFETTHAPENVSNKQEEMILRNINMNSNRYNTNNTNNDDLFNIISERISVKLNHTENTLINSIINQENNSMEKT
ncbi:centrosomal protein of 78 kDa-like isoform X3 [Centruroides sculpturatus]|nr:centrosomal protein of 78 kDa-like isoform X3 [Centruroides sculpturatus]XP_023232876.1 centrosomal protein of 78 kDa-like isoform X3 [Centruroides sculpturatus]